MIGVRVSLSSGDSFYLDAHLHDVARALEHDGLLMELGGRYVNPAQVAQLTVEPIPSIEIPERLVLEKNA